MHTNGFPGDSDIMQSSRTPTATCSLYGCPHFRSSSRSFTVFTLKFIRHIYLCWIYKILCQSTIVATSFSVLQSFFFWEEGAPASIYRLGWGGGKSNGSLYFIVLDKYKCVYILFSNIIDMCRISWNVCVWYYWCTCAAAAAAADVCTDTEQIQI